MSNANFPKIMVAQGGGPTAINNQSLVGVVLKARKFQRIQKVYGAFHGIVSRESAVVDRGGHSI